MEGEGPERLGKRELLQISREVEKLERSLGGIKDMNVLPDALFVVDVGYETIAVKEANKLGIQVVAVVDKNNPLTGIDYIIPGNDDAIRAIKLYTSATADAIIEAKASVQVMTGNEDDFVEVKEDATAKKPKAAKRKPAAKKAKEANPEEASEEVAEKEPVAAKSDETAAE